MSALLIRLGITAAVTAGAALIAWLQYRRLHTSNDYYQTGPRIQEGICILCLEGYSSFSKKFKTPCNHVLHWECARILFTQRSNSCPKCREHISSDYVRRVGLMVEY